MYSYLDILPSNEREKIQKRLRSPEAYERLRDRVKGPEDLEREMERSEQLAEVHMTLESEPHAKEEVKNSIEHDIAEQGIEAVADTSNASPEAIAALEKGSFDVAVDVDPATQEDALVLLSEGNVAEKVAIRPSFSEQYVAQIQGNRSQ